MSCGSCEACSETRVECAAQSNPDPELRHCGCRVLNTHSPWRHIDATHTSTCSSTCHTCIYMYVHMYHTHIYMLIHVSHHTYAYIHHAHTHHPHTYTSHTYRHHTHHAYAHTTHALHTCICVHVHHTCTHLVFPGGCCSGPG